MAGIFPKPQKNSGLQGLHFIEDWKNMVYKRFSLVIIVRTFFLCVSIFGLFYLISATTLYATIFIVIIIIIYQVYALIQFVQKTNKEIARFFNSIKYSDFSQSFRTSIKGTAFEELSNAFSDVVEEFRKTRTEKEEHFRYLQTVVQHVGIGLLAYTDDGNVELINTAAKKLLRVHGLKNTSELINFNRQLVEALNKIKAGDRILVKVADNNELSQLSIYAAEFKLRNNHYTLVSISNIQNELEEKEMEAWQNLIRVLTHEIMNSVTPIVSLSSTTSSLLREIEDKIKERSELNSNEFEDVTGALNTILKRSKGLLHFVDDYRNLTRIPAPNFQVVRMFSLFERIKKLFSEQLNEKNISLSINTEPADLEVIADPNLIEQVLINLVLNSTKALSETTLPEIKLIGKFDNRGNIIIQVIDNGSGISQDLHEKIFIPFFTTRKEGSGIGLSLSRQIMRGHKGGLTVSSVPGKETTFTLRF
jgi:nitrogen fixation/metabolism regulation signal transduction histidine kinase